MKTKIFATLFLLATAVSGLFAQTTTTTTTATTIPIKIGYTDPEYILSLLPEYKQIESELRSYEKQLQVQLESKMKEYQVKFEAYQKDYATYPDIVKQDKEKELLSMKTNIQEFEENAMSSMQKKQNQLLDPVIQKIQKAIDDVAEENGYTYIFSTAVGNNGAIILYARNKSEDISELVLKKMGVTLPAKTETGTTTTTPNTNTTGNTGTNTNTTTPSNTTTAPVKKK